MPRGTWLRDPCSSRPPRAAELVSSPLWLTQLFWFPSKSSLQPSQKSPHQLFMSPVLLLCVPPSKPALLQKTETLPEGGWTSQEAFPTCAKLDALSSTSQRQVPSGNLKAGRTPVRATLGLDYLSETSIGSPIRNCCVEGEVDPRFQQPHISSVENSLLRSPA